MRHCTCQKLGISTIAAIVLVAVIIAVLMSCTGCHALSGLGTDIHRMAESTRSAMTKEEVRYDH